MAEREERPVSGHAALRAERRGKALEVVATGDLDMAAAFRLENELDALLAENDPEALVLDLGQVTFVDSAGIGALLSVREQAIRRGVELKIARVSSPVRRVLDLAGVGDLINGG
ncbi:MAG TPA: STAS domain-containing protein [Solirubrobacter sp.]|nr:STAS domain-containing protein [Solirubrobacter sp.]